MEEDCDISVRIHTSCAISSSNSSSFNESATSSSSNLHQELQVSQSAEDDLEKTVCSLQRENAQQAALIFDLKQRLANLFVDSSEAREVGLAEQNAQLDALRAEYNSLQQSQMWYRSHLADTQENTHRLESELGRLRGLLQSAQICAASTAQENGAASLRLALREQSLLSEKRQLAERLEKVRVDMIEREAFFEQIAQERDQLESACRLKLADAARQRNRVHELQRQLDELSAEAAQLSEQVVLSGGALQAAVDEKVRLQQRLADMTEQLRHQEEQQIAVASASAPDEQHLDLQVRLRCVEKEKSALIEGLEQMRAKLQHVQDAFDTLQTQLESKRHALANGEELRDALANELLEARAEVNLRSQMAAEVEQQRVAALEALHQLELANGELRGQVDSLRESLELAELQAAERTRMCDELQAENADMKNALREIRGEVEQLRSEQGRYTALLEEHSVLRKRVAQLEGEGAATHEAHLSEIALLRCEMEQREQDWTRAAERNALRLAALEAEVTSGREARFLLERELHQQEWRQREMAAGEMAEQTRLIEQLRLDLIAAQERVERAERGLLQPKSTAISSTAMHEVVVGARHLEQISEQAAQIEALEGELAAVETARQQELQHRLEESNNLRRLVAASQHETTQLRNALSQARDERASLQGQLAKLRGALRAAINRYKLFSGVDAASDEETLEDAAFDWRRLSQLLDECDSLASAGRPLQSLTSFLEDIRGEMDRLVSSGEVASGRLDSASNLVTESSWRRDLVAAAQELKETCDQVNQKQQQHPRSGNDEDDDNQGVA